MNKTFVVVGPTASGKSSLAVKLAKELNGEVIGLDSRQIYRFMEIGTAQPTPEEMNGIQHHLFGEINPDQAISSGEYAKMVGDREKGTLIRERVPIVCGGSGLYFRALTTGFFDGSGTDENIRKKLKEQLEIKGSIKLLEKLKKIDPEYAEIVHSNNHKRLLRALEIYEMTGLPPSEHFRRQKLNSQKQNQYFTIYLKGSLDSIAKRIENRTASMLKNGWVEEVKSLLEKVYRTDCHPMDSIGYREIIQHLNGGLDYDDMVDLINLRTRKYAKKQMKWFDKEKIDLTINIDDSESILQEIIFTTKGL
jgi:tRNA dimethylallyltransferase|tara:strand:+ start:1120 stop:2040 length:921 start_codon:yes stop_codon:yes gene_type:complete